MPGRKRTPQDFVLGIDFGGTKIDVGTADLGGEALLSGRLETEANSGAAQAVDRALGLARGLVERSAEGGGRCLAAGVVSPGIVREDAVLLAPNVPGWGELRLPERVGAALDGVPVAAGNDVNAAALAESRWGALHAADPGLFISLGTGIKAAIVIGGRVFTGANGAAGEIGYSLRHAEGGNGFANGRAPLEEFVGGRAIGERAGRLLGEELSAADVFARSDLPADFIADTLSELSLHVANLAIAIDPARIAVGGGLMAHGALILAALDERLRAASPFRPAVVPARFLYDGALRGAFALALDLAGERSGESVEVGA